MKKKAKERKRQVIKLSEDGWISWYRQDDPCYALFNSDLADYAQQDSWEICEPFCSECLIGTTFPPRGSLPESENTSITLPIMENTGVTFPKVAENTWFEFSPGPIDPPFRGKKIELGRYDEESGEITSIGVKLWVPSEHDRPFLDMDVELYWRFAE